MAWVMDCSVAAALALPDEDSPLATRFLAKARDQGEDIWVPPLWWYEVTNTVVSAVRRKRLGRAQAEATLEAYGHIGVKQDNADLLPAMQRSHSLALKHGLTAYDATYLELAVRRALVLATLDDKLKAAARQTGVEVFS